MTNLFVLIFQRTDKYHCSVVRPVLFYQCDVNGLGWLDTPSWESSSEASEGLMITSLGELRFDMYFGQQKARLLIADSVEVRQR